MGENKFETGDEVKVTEDFTGARSWVGRWGVLLIHLNPMESGYDWVMALSGDEMDVLYVNEEEIEHV